MYLDVNGVAQALGMGIVAVYQSVEEFGAVKIRGRWRFPVDKLPGQPRYGVKDDVER